MIKKLQTKKHIRKDGWVAFAIDPVNSRALEDNTFKPLQGIIQEIIKSSESSSVVDFAQNSHCAPWSDRTNHTRPDGYFILKDPGPIPGPVPTANGKGKGKAKSSESLVKWDVIALSVELKKESAADTRDDVSSPVLMYNITLSCSFRMCGRFYGVCNMSCVAIFVAGLPSVSQLRTRKCGYGFAVARWLLSPSHLISSRRVIFFDL